MTAKFAKKALVSVPMGVFVALIVISGMLSLSPPARFRETEEIAMASLPQKQRAAIIYLYHRDRYLSDSFRGLCRFFKFSYPVVILYGEADGVDKAQMREVSQLFESHCREHNNNGLSLTFRPVKLPDLSHRISKSNTLYNYTQMIRFFTEWIFKDTWLTSRFDYLLRLDTDSEFASDVFLDPFVVMAKGHHKYGYLSACNDLKSVSSGIISWGTQQVPPPYAFRGFPGDLEQTPMMYSNFEVLDLRFFTQPSIMRLAEASEANTCQYRWGDAPLRALTIGIFAREEDIVHLNYFSYFHGRIDTATRDSRRLDIFNPMVLSFDPQVWMGGHGIDIGHCLSSFLNKTKSGQATKLYEYYSKELPMKSSVPKPA
eukprot:CAMPEP_0196657882 /NCGR_PEP_ID=MMETSP1086-20130531/26213_1 /TAXON_ID=77921 /ORGANISM="Cyanoptyche  gloeocystis , Strain SAG4.97" /LENGTH=371 /DNA_ID=CAMNT_0041991195 /DNA_START=48 /DNA_END=1163 /DNA_ORIENTATION=+